MVLHELKTAWQLLRAHHVVHSSLAGQFAAISTSYLLGFFSVVITANLMVGSSIECSSAEDSTLSQNFVHAFCWNENLFSFAELQKRKFSKVVPYPGIGPVSFHEDKEVKEVRLTFHQWVPLLLAL